MSADRAGADGAALLVVDDNEDNRYTLVQRLKRQGYTNVTTANHGVEALALLRERSFDLVLLDVTMPEMNGYEVLEHLKVDVKLRHVPVIMISALDQVESVVRCIELGAEDYLPKPFNPTLLKARVGASLEKKRLRDELHAHVARIEAELESAREMQLSMVPREFPAPTAEVPVGIFASLYPARQIGGDLYDFFHLGPRTLCVVVADVSDKGAAAALFMARTKTLIRTLATAMRGADGAAPEPHEMIARMNEELCQDNPLSMFASVVLGTLDLVSHELRFCNAGHPVPYVVGAAGVRALAAPRAKPLGIRRTFTYVTTRDQLQVGDCVFLFTDGVTEALDTNGELFSEARLETVLQSVAEDSTQRVVSSVVEAVRRFAGSAPQSDDIAALAIRLVGVPRVTRRAVATITGDADVARLAALLDELARAHALDADTVADMQVALDEVVSNVLRHGFVDGRPHRIDVTLSVGPDALVAEIEDDCAPFDPLAIAPPDRSGSLQDRNVGGLGVHFVKNLMSEVSYARARAGNRLVLRKALGGREGDVHGAA